MPSKEKSAKTLKRAEEEGVSPVGGDGEGTLILPYIRRLGPFLDVKILNFNIFGVFQKDEYFWGLWVGGVMMKLWIFLGGFAKPDYF